MNSTIAIILLAVIAFLVYRLVKKQAVGKPLVKAVTPDENSFLVEFEND